MRVLVATTAGAGHFGPLLPFAVACRRAGHDVLVAAPRSFAPAVERAGYPFWPCDDLPEAEWRAVMAKLPELSPEEANALVVGEVFACLDARSVLPRMMAAVEEWRPDLVLRENAEFGSYVAAERHGVPHVRVAIGLGLFEEWGKSLVVASLNEIRASVGMPADEGGGHYVTSPCFSLVPPSLEDPDDPGPAHALRFRDDREPEPAAPLPEWWGGNADPLVYVTFGSVTGTVPMFTSVYEAVVGALAGLPVRLLVTVGEGFDPSALGPVPPNVHVERWVPQAEVLGHARAVVCHGGFNTVLGALVAGVPMVVVPLFADQPDNARRVAAVGAGLAVEGGPSDADALRRAVSRVLDDGRYREAAKRISAEIRALPSADTAVERMVEIAGRS